MTVLGIAFYVVVVGAPSPEGVVFHSPLIGVCNPGAGGPLVSRFVILCSLHVAYL